MCRVFPMFIPDWLAPLFVPIWRPIIFCPALSCSSVKSRLLASASLGPYAPVYIKQTSQLVLHNHLSYLNWIMNKVNQNILVKVEYIFATFITRSRFKSVSNIMIYFSQNWMIKYEFNICHVDGKSTMTRINYIDMTLTFTFDLYLSGQGTDSDNTLVEILTLVQVYCLEHLVIGDS